MAGNTNLLSLAYMIEISFVLNLAYHELDTFKLRRRVRFLVSKMNDRFSEMDRHGIMGNLPQYEVLMNFHRGRDENAWEKHRRFYRMVYKGGDRLIVRILLALNVIILCVATANSDVTLVPFSTSGWICTFWTVSFYCLILTIIIPVWFMRKVRLCYRYVWGIAPEKIDDFTISESPGRFHTLEQDTLDDFKKWDQVVEESIDKNHSKDA